MIYNDEWQAKLGRCHDDLDAALGRTAPIPEGYLKDAERYRWLRDSGTDVGGVLDKITGELPSGFPIYEYRAGDELDAAIDAAMLAAATKP